MHRWSFWSSPWSRTLRWFLWPPSWLSSNQSLFWFTTTSLVQIRWSHAAVLIVLWGLVPVSGACSPISSALAMLRLCVVRPHETSWCLTSWSWSILWWCCRCQVIGSSVGGCLQLVEPLTVCRMKKKCVEAKSVERRAQRSTRDLLQVWQTWFWPISRLWVRSCRHWGSATAAPWPW